METVSNFLGKRDDLSKKILIVAAAIIGLMILFPPKVIVNKNPLIGQSMSESAGYSFIFSDPAAEQKSAAKQMLGDQVDEVISSGIQWGKLFLQVIVVAGVAFAASRFLTRRQPDGTGRYAS